MKRFFLVLCFVVLGAALFCIVSCSDDDNSSSTGTTGATTDGKAQVTPDQDGKVDTTEDGETKEITPSPEGLRAFTCLNISDMTLADPAGKKDQIAQVTIKNNIKIVASDTQKIEIDTSSSTVGSTKYTKRLKLGGTGSKTKRNVTIYVGQNVEGTLTVVLASSSSSDATRAFMANDTELGKAPTKASTLSGRVKADALGYIALYSGNGGGINLYQISFSTGNAGQGTTTQSTGDIKSNVSEKQKPILDNTTLAPQYDNGTQVGKRTKLGDIDPAKIKNVWYVSPEGTPTGQGTKESPLDIFTAVALVQAGGAVVLKSGVYDLDKTLTIAETNNGQETALKYMLPEDKNGAVLDFSRQETADMARGVQLNGSYWHIYGITCYNAGDNGMMVSGKHNIIERCVFQANQDTGLQIARRASTLSNKADWPSDNLILNCTSFDNKDDKTGENADGFAAKLTCGEGNEFNGCISFANCDDGWDMYAKEATGSIGVVKILNCMSLQNGKTTTGAAYANGDMNGFKLGGSNNKCPTAHIVKNCISFANGKDGFTDNGNGGALEISNCSAFGNVNENFNFYRTFKGKFTKLIGSTDITPKQNDKFGDKNTPSKISYSVYLVDKAKKSYYHVEQEADITNGEKVGQAVADPKTEFVSAIAPTLDYTLDGKCRNKDGTINVSGYLEVKATSTYLGYGAKFGSRAEEVLDITLEMN